MEHQRLKKSYPGVHDAIIDKETFEAVQEQLSRRYIKKEERKKYLYAQGLLHSKLFNSENQPFQFKNSKNNGRRFNYYAVRGGAYLPVEQIDAFAGKSINHILDMDLKGFGDGILAEDFKLFIKKVPTIKSDNMKMFIAKAVYLVKEGVSELIIYIDIAEFIKFLHSHSVDNYYNEKAIPCDGISVSKDKKQIIIRTEFVIDNMTKTRLTNGPLRNVLTIREMNEGLVRGLALGWKFAKALYAGKTLKDLEKESGLQHRTIYRYINLRYLSPKIIKDIFNNKNPKNIRLVELMALADRHINFREQEKVWCDT